MLAGCWFHVAVIAWQQWCNVVTLIVDTVVGVGVLIGRQLLAVSTLTFRLLTFNVHVQLNIQPGQWQESTISDIISAIKSQNTVKPNPLCRLPVTSATSRDVPFSPNSITPTSPKLPWTGSFGEVSVMEFGLKGTSRLVADVTGSRHSGLGFTVFWLFTSVTLLGWRRANTTHNCSFLRQLNDRMFWRRHFDLFAVQTDVVQVSDGWTDKSQMDTLHYRTTHPYNSFNSQFHCLSMLTCWPITGFTGVNNLLPLPGRIVFVSLLIMSLCRRSGDIYSFASWQNRLFGGVFSPSSVKRGRTHIVLR